MMNKRERYLGLLVLAIAGGYGLFLVVQRAFLAPLDSQVTQIRGLNQAIATSKKEMERAMTAAGKLSEWEKLSLPADPKVAQAMYYEYLLKLLRDCKLDERDCMPSVEKPQPGPGNFYTIVPFKISGKMTLETLTELLYRFSAHQESVLHQIRSVTISRVNDPSGKVQVNMSVAALALNTAQPRKELLPEGGDKSSPVIAGKPREQFKLIASKNIFEPFKEPRREPERPREPEIDSARHVVLSGFTSTGDEPEAWLYNRLTNESKLFHPGDDLDIGGVKGKLASVSASGIVLVIDDKEWSLKLGKNLRDMKRLGEAPAATGTANGSENPSLEKSQGGKPEAATETKADDTTGAAAGPNVKANSESTTGEQPEKPVSSPASDETPVDSAGEAKKVE